MFPGGSGDGGGTTKRLLAAPFGDMPQKATALVFVCWFDLTLFIITRRSATSGSSRSRITVRERLNASNTCHQILVLTVVGSDFFRGDTLVEELDVSPFATKNMVDNR